MADDRLISADKFKRFLCECCNALNAGEPCEPADCNVMLVIDQQPTVDAVEVVHGQWIMYLDGDSIMPDRFYRCSECCDRGWGRKWPYCPNCGAKMDGGSANG